jgi:hypothetical protein
VSELVAERLPELDRDYLAEKEWDFEVTADAGGTLYLVVHNFSFPRYVPNGADLLIIIPASYPNAQLDMFWTNPDVKLPNGDWPQAGTHHEEYVGRSWQRWSRHNTQQWRPGVDSLRSFFAAMRKEIDKGI